MSKIRAKRSQSNWKCAQNWPLRCLLRTEECWTHNLLYTVCVLIISICATWFISLLQCHLSCYILWWCQMITLMSTWYANKYLAFSFLTIFIFYLPGKHGKHFLAGQIPKSFKKKFGKRQAVISNLQTAGANWHYSKFYIKRQEQIIHHMVFFSSFVDIFHQYMI